MTTIPISYRLRYRVAGAWKSRTLTHRRDAAAALRDLPPCKDCGAPGAYVIDPYAEEIGGTRMVMALCPNCRTQRAQDI